MNRKTKTILGIVVVGVLVLGGVIGGVVNHALAQPGTGQGDASTPKEEFLSSVAAKLGVPVDQLKGAVQSTELEMLDKAVEQGKVRPEVADRLRQRIEEGQVLPSLPRLAACGAAEASVSDWFSAPLQTFST